VTGEGEAQIPACLAREGAGIKEKRALEEAFSLRELAKPGELAPHLACMGVRSERAREAFRGEEVQERGEGEAFAFRELRVSAARGEKAGDRETEASEKGGELARRARRFRAHSRRSEKRRRRHEKRRHEKRRHEKRRRREGEEKEKGEEAQLKAGNLHPETTNKGEVRGARAPHGRKFRARYGFRSRWRRDPGLARNKGSIDRLHTGARKREAPPRARRPRASRDEGARAPRARRSASKLANARKEKAKGGILPGEEEKAKGEEREARAPHRGEEEKA
jgi:hypothetical protein